MANRIVKLLKAENAQNYPGFYDCEFLCPGLVNYRDIDCGICNLDKEVIDAMLPSFLGKPVTILHQKVDPSNLERVSNGYVIGAYFDAPSGKYRCKFIATTDEARKKIADGWKVSCAYDVHELGPGGKRHAVSYQQNILKGSFTHLALVPPDKARYEDSTIDAVDSGMMVFQNSIGEGHLFKDKPKQEAKSMLKFKFSWPVTVENSLDKQDPEKTFIHIGDKKVSLKNLIEAHNSKSSVDENSEDVTEDSLIEFSNSKGEEVKISVKELVAAYNAKNATEDEDIAAKKKLADEEEKEAMNAMSDDEKKEYEKSDDMGKCSMRKNMKERKNAEDKAMKDADEKKSRENAIKAAEGEEARRVARENIKTFSVINSKGKNLSNMPAEAVSQDDGRTSTGAQRGKEYFAKKFGKK